MNVPSSPARPAERAQDCGLCLLVGGTFGQTMRWAPDPDAPAARVLAPGQVRLAVRAFSLGRPDLLRARHEAVRADGHWRRLPVSGIGEVIESQHPAWPRGAWVQGPLHVGTHRVADASRLDAEFRALHHAPDDLVPASGGQPAQDAAAAMWVGAGVVDEWLAQLRDGSQGAVAPRWLGLHGPSSAGASAPINDASWCKSPPPTCGPTFSIGHPGA